MKSTGGIILLVLFITLLSISSIQAKISISIENSPTFEHSPLIFALTPSQNFATAESFSFTNSDAFTTANQCKFFSKPTPYDLIMDPSDSYHKLGNCFYSSASSTTIDGNDIVGTLSHPDDLDCTQTGSKNILVFTAAVPISQGQRIRCLGLTIPDSATTTTTSIQRSINVNSDQTTTIVDIKAPVLDTITVQGAEEYATLNNKRYVLLSMKIDLSAESKSAQVYPLSAIAQYESNTTPEDYSYSTNLFFNSATFGSYSHHDAITGVQNDAWTPLCFPSSQNSKLQSNPVTNTAVARLYVSEYQEGPEVESQIPSGRVYEGQKQTNLLVSGQERSFNCKFPIALPPLPANVLDKVYTPINISIGGKTITYQLPYKTIPQLSPLPTDINTPITEIAVDSYTTYTIPANNASVSYIFNLHLDMPLFSPEFYQQTTLPTLPVQKYILTPTGTKGENTSLEKALDLLFPATATTVVWSILTPTVQTTTFSYNSSSKQFEIDWTPSTTPSASGNKIVLQFQVRFATISFSPPINALSEQTSFDVLFSLSAAASPAVILNRNPLYYRVRPVFLLQDIVGTLRPSTWQNIRFTARFRALGFPGAQYGRWKEVDDDDTYPQLKCWIELNDDIGPRDGTKPVLMKMAVTGQNPLKKVKGPPKGTYEVYKYQNYFYRSSDLATQFVFGGKSQITTLDIEIPVEKFNIFPFKYAVLSLSCGFDHMQPVTVNYDKFSSDGVTPNPARLQFAMDETASYLTTYSGPTSFTATTSPFILRVTTDKDVGSQWDLEIVESAVFDALKLSLQNADGDSKRLFGSMDWYDLRYYVPRSTSLSLQSQGVLSLGLDGVRDKATTTTEQLLTPLAQAFTNAPRFLSTRSTSTKTTGIDNENVFKVNSPSDTARGNGALLHFLVNPFYISQFAFDNDRLTSILSSMEFQSSVLDYTKHRVRVEVLPYDQSKDIDQLGGYPYQAKCDAMRITSKFNAIGYLYPGANPTCGFRPVGQSCSQHNQCGGGYCDPKTWKCVRSLASIAVISNTTAVDKMSSVFIAEPMGTATGVHGVFVVIGAVLVLCLGMLF